MARGLGLGMAPEILPETVVMRTPEVTAWWVPATVRPMFFSETSDGKTLNGKFYPHPPLVFVVDGEHRLSVRALLEDRRPAAAERHCDCALLERQPGRGSLSWLNGHTALGRAGRPGGVG